MKNTVAVFYANVFAALGCNDTSLQQNDGSAMDSSFQDSGLLDASLDAPPPGDATSGTWHTDFKNTPNARCVWGVADNLFLCTKNGEIVRLKTDGTWVAIQPAAPIGATILWGSSPDDLYVSNETSVWHWDGNTWMPGQLPELFSLIKAGWSSGPNDSYAVGSNGKDESIILHTSGDGTWSVQENGTTGDLYDIWGSGPNDIYALGQFGPILHSNGNGVWSLGQELGFGSPTGIWGTGPDNLYAVLGDNTIYHSTGGGDWTKESAKTVDLNGDNARCDFGKVWGLSPNEVYVLGTGGVVMHSTGDGTWQQQTTMGIVPAGSALGIAGNTLGHIVAVSDTGVLVKP